MNLYLKSRIFSWGDRYAVYDKNGQEIFFVKGKAFAIGKNFRIVDMDDRELIFVQRKTFGAQPQYHISKNGMDMAVVEKDFSMFSHAYKVNGLDWRAEGHFFEHEYEIKNGDLAVARVTKQVFAHGNGYEISISPDVDEMMVLAVVLIVHTCIDSENNS